LALEDLIKPNDFYLIIDSIEKKVISKSNLKEILDKIWGENINISSVIENYSSRNENNLDMIDDLIKKIIEKNEKQVKEYKSGKTKIVGFFVGQVLKDAKGSDPSVIKDKIISYLDSI
jgi:aspartyl-tRNA(Asn)/glutamyl-tRNA(Gln) amidotransferase subunit B